MTAPFVSIADLATVFKRTPDDDAWTVALDSACEMVRRYCAQTFNYVQGDVAELPGSRDEYQTLPERPVIDVTAVSVYWNGQTQDIAVGSLKWTRNGKMFARLPSGLVLNGWSPWDNDSSWGGSEGTLVTVTYDHGYAVEEADVDLGAGIKRMPSDVRRVALGVAVRLLERTSEEAKNEIGYVGEVSRVMDMADSFLRDDEKERLAPWRNAGVLSVGTVGLG